MAEKYENVDDLIQAIVDARTDGIQAVWRIGDIVLAAREQFGPPVMKHLSGATGYTRRWLEVLWRVAQAFRPSERRLDVTFEMYRGAVDLAPDDPHTWVNKALQEGWSAADLRRALVTYRSGTSGKAKQKAITLSRQVTIVEPYLRKDLLLPEQAKDWQIQWYQQGIDATLSLLRNAAKVAKLYQLLLPEGDSLSLKER